VAQEVGGTWLRIFGELSETIRTGEPQSHRVFGMGWWDWLNANPTELANFGEAMKANSQNSMEGVLEKCDFRGVAKIADLGGGFGHLVIALLEKYPTLNGIIVDLPELIPVAKEKNPAPNGVASRLEYHGQNMFERVPPADAYIMKHIIHDFRASHLCRCGAAADGRYFGDVGKVSGPADDGRDSRQRANAEAVGRTLRRGRVPHYQCDSAAG
jgi:hypothetical protein